MILNSPKSRSLLPLLFVSLMFRPAAKYLRTVLRSVSLRAETLLAEKSVFSLLCQIRIFRFRSQARYLRTASELPSYTNKTDIGLGLNKAWNESTHEPDMRAKMFPTRFWCCVAYDPIWARSILSPFNFLRDATEARAGKTNGNSAGLLCIC